MDASIGQGDDEPSLEDLPQALKNKLEKKLGEGNGVDQPDSKKSRREILCEQCNNSQSKYTCPKCAFRSCSVACVKQHKVERLCDGMPQKWTAVAKISEFSPLTSTRDQGFLHDIKDKVLPEGSNGDQNSEAQNGDVQRQRPKMFSAVINYLLGSCRMRRIWLSINEENEAEGSRHEGFSDTIFWTIKVTFARSKNWEWASMPEKAQTTKVLEVVGLENSEKEAQEQNEEKKEGIKVEVVDKEEIIPTESPSGDIEDGELPSDHEENGTSEIAEENDRQSAPEEVVLDDFEAVDPVEDVGVAPEDDDSELLSHSYVVSNIPETLTVRTLIRQFAQPKVYGPVISKSDLDLEKMDPFLKHPGELIAYMPVNCNGTTRYYGIDTERSFLDNLRNRFVVGRPELIILLNKDPRVMVAPTSEEIDNLHQQRKDKQHNESPHFHRKPRNNYNNYNNNRGGFGHRRGGGGGNRPQRGGSNFQNRGPKRHYQHREDPLENILASSNIRQKDIAAMGPAP
ncbi:unnamed protein product [Bursaphelenchus xylophilus]|uniref:(pine wood nematode) hypothetical protein n=1 Tax=Bursaphelenchus xylophilus TaxID=6326 RepID=A0A1I7RSV3_BURXY|nr:unnamed protein product [Bursaphelenchus xylophilus]CAG9122791.1 unnamed protein product [Bursaphelenchus xylophilus]